MILFQREQIRREQVLKKQNLKKQIPGKPLQSIFLPDDPIGLCIPSQCLSINLIRR